MQKLTFHFRRISEFPVPLTRPIVILLKLNTPEFLSDLFLAHIYLTNKPRVVATACSLDQISVIYQRDIR